MPILFISISVMRAKENILLWNKKHALWKTCTIKSSKQEQIEILDENSRDIHEVGVAYSKSTNESKGLGTRLEHAERSSPPPRNRKKLL